MSRRFLLDQRREFLRRVGLVLLAPGTFVPAQATSTLVGAAGRMVPVIGSVAQLRLHRTDQDHVVYVSGHSMPGDGGEGLFRWEANSTARDDGGTVIATRAERGRWIRQGAETPTALMFGAHGDAKYEPRGLKLVQGTDDTQAIARWLAAAPAAGNHKQGGGTLHLPAGVYRTSGGYAIANHNTTLRGEGYGASILHFERNANLARSRPALHWTRPVTRDAESDLLRGGGIKNLSLRTDNAHIMPQALMLEYVEYMRFEDITIEGFLQSAIKGGFWESEFRNVTIRGCGAGLRANANGAPESGVIDTDSGNADNPRRDASNNTMFSNVKLSSCFGTLLRLTSGANTTANIHFAGLYAETYFHDAGNVDDLPLVYIQGAMGTVISMGFFTVNSTGVARQSTIVKIASDPRNGVVTFRDIIFTMNPKARFQRATRRLRSFMDIGQGVHVHLSSCTLNDPSDAVGYGLNPRPALVQGQGKFTFDVLTVNTHASEHGGTRGIQHLFEEGLRASGHVWWRPFNANGPILNRDEYYEFSEGRARRLR